MYSKFIEKAKEIYQGEPTGHDFSHIERVLAYCRTIQESVGGDMYIITISALFHDIHRVLSNKEGKFVSAEASIPYVREILKEFDIDSDSLEKILYIIQEHDNKVNDINMPIELQIVQDADILDAIGEIGLNRTLIYCKNKNIPLVDKSHPLDDKDYIPNINPYSTTHYVYRTMIPQANLLHTDIAKKIGINQVAILEKFVRDNLE